MTAIPKPRAPWWMYVIACAFAADFCVSTYVSFWGPEPLGLVAASVAGHTTVRSVQPDSPASRATIQSGDQIAAVGGLVILSGWDWSAAQYNTEAGHPIVVHIVRAGQPLDRAIQPNRHPLSYWKSRDGVCRLISIFAELVYLAVAFWIAFSQPFNVLARLGALFIASAAVSQIYQVDGVDALIRRLPLPLQLLLWIELILRNLGMGVFFTFFAMFPRVFFRSRWIWAMAWIPILAFLPLQLHSILYSIYFPTESVPMPEWVYLAAPIYWLFYVPLGPLLLYFNYKRLTDLTERRRVRVIVVGLAITVLMSLPSYVAGMPGISGGPLDSFLRSPTVVVIAAIATLALPASFAYAILRHCLFDIRLIIRQGLQYGAARNGLIFITPAFFTLLALDLLLHRDQSLNLIMRDRGWIYILVAILAIWLHVRRKQWLVALDRRFFREQYNAQQVLGATVQEVRRAASPEEVAPRLIAQIESAFHPTMAGVLLRDSGADRYRALSLSPADAPGIEFSATARFCRLAEVVGKPVHIGDRGDSLSSHLPEDEIEIVRRSQIDWLIPISLAAKGAAAFLAVGPKRSEQPYSREDLDLLQSVAGSLALLLERSENAHDTEELCLECPSCGTCYPYGSANCPADGQALVRTTIQRYLQARFRLDRRIGRGGMGIVYEATDTRLARRVAVKFLGDDRLNDASAVARFSREARLLAAFQHPHVVTVFDAGNTVSGRVFIVMELLRGTTLRDELAKHGGLPIGRVTEILGGICAAVDAAHRQSIIHRDLKPENVFLAERDGATITKVLDFGLAKLFDSEAATLRNR